MTRAVQSLLLAALTAGLLAAGSSHAAVITIHADGSGDYPTIQDALNAAAPRDVIQLSDGVYTGPGNREIDFLGKAVTLQSASGDPDACIIDVQGIPGNVVSEKGLILVSGEGEETVIRDLTIAHADADGPCPSCEGGAIVIRHGSPQFINVTIRNNYALNGAGAFIYGTDAHPVFERCRFLYNVGMTGIGVRLAESSPLINAGDPDAPLDPDGTVADIGAYYFDQAGAGSGGAPDEPPVAAGEAGHGPGAQLPARFEIASVYPNPFNASAKVRVSVPEAGRVSVRVFDVLGRETARIADRAVAAGAHTFTFDAGTLSSGTYFIEASSPRFGRHLRRISLLR